MGSALSRREAVVALAAVTPRPWSRPVRGLAAVAASLGGQALLLAWDSTTSTSGCSAGQESDCGLPYLLLGWFFALAAAVLGAITGVAALVSGRRTRTRSPAS